MIFLTVAALQPVKYTRMWPCRHARIIKDASEQHELIGFSKLITNTKLLFENLLLLAEHYRSAALQPENTRTSNKLSKADGGRRSVGGRKTSGKRKRSYSG